MKTGGSRSGEIASFTKASGLKLMMGGMVETRMAIGCSFSLSWDLGITTCSTSTPHSVVMTRHGGYE